MKTRKCQSASYCFLPLIISMLSIPGVVFGEVPNRTQESLVRGATDVIIGELRAVYSLKVDVSNYQITHLVAEIHVQKLEKGTNFRVGQMAYVRYWHQKWQGEGRPPPGTSGHRGVPPNGSIVRAYVTNDKELRRRPDKENDGGFDVILPNGLQLANERSETRKSD